MIETIPTQEDLHTEFKAAKRVLPKNLFDTICAFLNTDGGTVYLGIKDDGTIEGIEEAIVPELKKDIANLSNNEQKIDPPYLLFPKSIEIEGKVIIRLDVPLSSQLHQHKGAIYLRSEDGDYRVSGQHQLAGLLNRKLGIFSEQTPVAQFSPGDLQAELFEKARSYVRRRNQNHPWLGLSDTELLSRAGLLVRDGSQQAPKLTLAAILLFGSDAAIRQVVPGYKFDCLLRRKDTERFDDRLTLRTNLLDAYEQMMGFVEKHLNDPFYLERGASISLRERIFREAISNIIAHREYRDARPARLIVYKDRVILDNPATQYFHRPITPENLKSHPKNPSICQFLIQMGLFDELGSGVFNIYKYLPHYANGALPEFLDRPEGFQLIMPLKQSDDPITPEVTPEVTREVTPEVRKLLGVLKEAMGRKEIMSELGLKDEKHFRESYQQKAMQAGLIEYTIPDKPQSSLQKYRLTNKGRKALTSKT